MAEEKTKKSGCLVGCLSALGIVFLIIVVSGVIVVIKGPEIRNAILDQLDVGVSYLLTENHTPQEKELFLNSFRSLTDEIKQAGLKDGIQKNNEVIVELQTMLEDKQIDREESLKWVQMYRQKNTATPQDNYLNKLKLLQERLNNDKNLQ